MNTNNTGVGISFWVPIRADEKLDITIGKAKWRSETEEIEAGLADMRSLLGWLRLGRLICMLYVLCKMITVIKINKFIYFSYIAKN